MSWFLRLTRFGSAHAVYAQEKENSCGPSCILMTNFKLKKGLMFAGMAAAAEMEVVPVIGSYLGGTLSQAAIDYAVKTEPMVYKVYAKHAGLASYDGTAYSSCKYFPAVLDELGLGQWEAFWAGEAGVAQAAIDAVNKGAPVIVLIAWQGGGAHFICIDSIYEYFGNTYATVCDPGDGEVHVVTLTGGSKFTYVAGDEPISISTGEHFTYPAGQTGTANGWIVRRKP
jgi:hypothetical protein